MSVNVPESSDPTTILIRGTEFKTSATAKRVIRTLLRNGVATYLGDDLKGHAELKSIANQFGILCWRVSTRYTVLLDESLEEMVCTRSKNGAALNAPREYDEE